MRRITRLAPLAFAVALIVFSSLGWHLRPASNGATPIEVFDRVVIPAPLQILLTGGDRYLAADIEAVRALALPSDSPAATLDNLSFSIRARKTVAQLNPCHEDNFYLANALLTWSGAVREGNEVLRRAAECRFWDEFPPFFYGFNLYYFEHDVASATQAIDEAARRSKGNSNALRKLAIMLTAENIEDDLVALAYLENERDQARDAKLRETLGKRVIRLQGLIELRQAQSIYEQRFGTALTAPQALIETRILEKFPPDPINIGYEFVNGHFRMREVKILGLESQKK